MISKAGSRAQLRSSPLSLEDGGEDQAKESPMWSLSGRMGGSLGTTNALAPCK